MRKTCVLLALLVCAAANAAAQSAPVLETATYNPTADDGWRLGDTDHVAYGVRFTIAAPTAITKFGVGNLTGSGTFYVAIVPVTASGFPAGAPFNQGDVLAHATFSAQDGDQRVPLPVTLAAGTYMLVVGDSAYSTSGTGLIATAGQTRTPGSGTIYYSIADSGSWFAASNFTSGPSDPLRFVLEGPQDHVIILDAVNTRASQASLNALATTVGTLATQQHVSDLGASIGGSLAALAGIVNGRATQTDGNISALGSSVGSQFSSLFSSVSSLGGGTTLGQVASILGTKANEASVGALGGQLATLASSVGALGSSLTGLATAADVSAAAATVSGAVSSRASQASLDALAASLGTDGDLGVKLAIERALADGKRVASFILPASVGGHLERVHDIVNDLLTAGQQAGFDVTKARAQFAKGQAAHAAGDWKAAYDFFAAAYQLLIK